MGILMNLIDGVLYLLLAVTDIMLAFMLARCLCGRWRNQYVLAFDAAGKSLVDSVLALIDRQARRVYDGKLRESAKLVLCLFMLLLARILASALVNLIG